MRGNMERIPPGKPQKNLAALESFEVYTIHSLRPAGTKENSWIRR